MSGFIIAVLLFIVAILFLVAYFLNEARKKHRAASIELLNELAVKDKYILEVKKIEEQKTERIEKISTGSDSERFDGSLDVLSELSKGRRKTPGS